VRSGSKIYLNSASRERLMKASELEIEEEIQNLSLNLIDFVCLPDVTKPESVQRARELLNAEEENI
jgi:hypothetical protein